jgi:hypothetical protein
VFQPPADAKKVEVDDLGHMDEIPPGEIAGESK